MSFKWFGSEESESEPEVSPGGSIIHRYKNKTWFPTKAGFVDESIAAFAATREEVYRRLFGEPRKVFFEARPLIPHIDVHEYIESDDDGTTYCTLVTSGMSDLELRVPSTVKAPRRYELIFYCSESKPEYAETMRWLAHFPHDQKTWIGAGHTAPNGNPPAPFWGSSILDTILFMPSIVKRDRTLPDELILGGEGVHFLWVVPVTTPECDLKLAEGYNAIIALFKRHRHPYMFDPNRASYV